MKKNKKWTLVAVTGKGVWQFSSNREANLFIRTLVEEGFSRNDIAIGQENLEISKLPKLKRKQCREIR